MDLNFSVLGTREFLGFAEENGLEQGRLQLPQTGQAVNKKTFSFLTNYCVMLVYGGRRSNPTLPGNIRSPDLSTISFCLIVKHLPYLKAIEGGTDFWWMDSQGS